MERTGSANRSPGPHAPCFAGILTRNFRHERGRPLQCPRCGIDFIRGHQPKIYCSRKCSKAMWRRRTGSEKSRYKGRRESARTVARALKSVPCFDCGVSYPWYVMDFDHLRDKVAGVSDLHSATAVRREAAKCDVVCANCHRERTQRRATRPA